MPNPVFFYQCSIGLGVTAEVLWPISAELIKLTLIYSFTAYLSFIVLANIATFLNSNQNNSAIGGHATEIRKKYSLRIP